MACRSVLTSASAAGGHAVQHHGHHDVPGGGVQEQLPGDGVGVAVGRGDEDPQVGRGEQLAGEPAVVIGDGVDVRGIQQRNALPAPPDAPPAPARRWRCIRCGPGPAGWDRCVHHSAADPAEARQDPLVLEPAGVRRVVQQDRLPRGGPDGAGAGDGVAHQGVDEGGLSGAGGTAHDGEQGRVQAAVAGQDVVIELGQGVADIQPGRVRVGQGKGQVGCAKVAADSFQQLHGGSSP